MASHCDPEDLAEALDALAHPNRLRLVDGLREPRPLGDIDLVPQDSEAPRDRPMTREGVRYHLEKLREEGYVEVEQGKGPDNRYRHLYSLQETQLFQVCEQLLQLLDPLNGARQLAGEAENPRLVVVHGVGRGRWFDLGDPDEAPWVIGTGEKADLNLRGDPAIAGQHAEINADKRDHELVDYRHSGTTKRNWRPLDPGDSTPLQVGDVVEMGSTLLVYQSSPSET